MSKHEEKGEVSMRVCMEIPGRVVSSRDEKKTEREMGRYLDEISGVGADSIATTLIGGYRSNIFRTNTNGIPPVLRVAQERNFKVYLHFSCGYGLEAYGSGQRQDV